MQMPKGYPTPGLLERYLEAYQTEGEAGIKRVLREQKEKGEYVGEIIRESMLRRGSKPPQSLQDALERHLNKK